MPKEIVYKHCDICNKNTCQEILPLVTICLDCDTRRDDDADELFGPIGE